MLRAPHVRASAYFHQSPPQRRRGQPAAQRRLWGRRARQQSLTTQQPQQIPAAHGARPTHSGQGRGQRVRTPLAQRERCWKQLRTSSGASPTARYSSTYRHCQRRFFSSMPSAKSSVSVYSGDQPASLNAADRIRKLVPARPGRHAPVSAGVAVSEPGFSKGFSTHTALPLPLPPGTQARQGHVQPCSRRSAQPIMRQVEARARGAGPPDAAAHGDRPQVPRAWGGGAAPRRG